MKSARGGIEKYFWELHLYVYRSEELLKRAIPRAIVILLLIIATVLSVFDTSVGANNFTGSAIHKTAFRQSNMGVLPLRAFEDSAKILVDPKDSIYYTWEKRLNDTIAVNVTVANMTGLCGLEFKLYYNSSVLVCTGLTENLFHTVTPQSSWGNIWQIKKSINNTGGYLEYAYSYVDLNLAVKDGYAPANVTSPDYSEGKLAAAILTFTIVRMPPPNFYVESPLHMSFVQPIDIQRNVISVEVIDGYYKLISPTGDMNGDHIVDIYDAILFSNAFGSDPANSKWNPKADLNNDDTVDIFDALILAANFGKTIP